MGQTRVKDRWVFRKKRLATWHELIAETTAMAALIEHHTPEASFDLDFRSSGSVRLAVKLPSYGSGICRPVLAALVQNFADTSSRP
jgi:hypothetical protein